MMLVFLCFFLIPLVFVIVVSFWDYNEYQLLPAFSGRGYTDTFEGCIAKLPELCTIGRTYLMTLKLCFLVWAITLFIGFWVAYFLAFHVRTRTWQMGLSLLCTIPFWTSNVIRMIAWIPLLGRNGLVNSGLIGTGLIKQPIEWLLYSEFSIVLALVHLFTFFMVVPIFNSMVRIDRSLIEAAYDAGATGFQTLVNVIIPLAKPGIVIGSIFVITRRTSDLDVAVRPAHHVRDLQPLRSAAGGSRPRPWRNAMAVIPTCRAADHPPVRDRNRPVRIHAVLG
jgi:putative spermidine/putrescine transport system permease protein